MATRPPIPASRLVASRAAFVATLVVATAGFVWLVATLASAAFAG